VGKRSYRQDPRYPWQAELIALDEGAARTLVLTSASIRTPKYWPAKIIDQVFRYLAVYPAEAQFQIADLSGSFEHGDLWLEAIIICKLLGHTHTASIEAVPLSSSANERQARTCQSCLLCMSLC
jgi:hypothetical protein